MAKKRHGSLVEKNGRKYIRVQWTDEAGQKHDKVKPVRNILHFESERRAFLREIEQKEKGKKQYPKTFLELADYFEREYAKPPVYVQDTKIDGCRSHKTTKGYLKVFRRYFGSKRLQDVQYDDLRAYKRHRLATKVAGGRTRSLATVNRELSKLRRIFNLAVKRGWLKISPFHMGDPLISLADESPRNRILSGAEEIRLLAAIEAEPKREHLRPVVLLALDCALRRGEILTLTWGDVDLAGRVLTLRAYNTKTVRTRKVALTARVFHALMHLQGKSICAPTQLIFGGLKTFRTAFNKACAKAGVHDFRFHDCRATAITRMLRAGLSVPDSMRISGHATLRAFYVYCRVDDDLLHHAAATLDAYNAKVSALP